MRRFWWFLRFIWQFRSSLTLALIFKALFRLWTSPNTMVAGDIFSASNYNLYVRDNLNYLFSGRPGSVIKRDNNATYSTTSNTFVDVDTTNLSITLTISSGKAIIHFSGVCVSSSGAGADGGIDVDIDGTRYGSAFSFGLMIIQASTTPQNCAFSVPVTGLSVGAHTFKLQYRRGSAGTVSIYSGDAATVTSDKALIFGVEEMG